MYSEMVQWTDYNTSTKKKLKDITVAWDPSRGALFDPRGPTLLLLTVVLLRVLRFLPTLPLLGGSRLHLGGSEQNRKFNCVKFLIKSIREQ